MASAQAMGVNDKHEKEIVQQMVENSKSFAKNSIDVAQSQEGVVATINNNTPGMINFNQSFDWFGSGKLYPPTILSNNNDRFVHLGVPPNGSSGAVIYYGYNKQGTSCAWLLAWSAPTKTTATPNKVYVDCGISSNFGPNMDWNIIQTKLNASDAYANHWDPVTQTTIYAEISPGGNFAALGTNLGAN